MLAQYEREKCMGLLLFSILVMCMIAAIYYGGKAGGELGRDFYAIRKNAAEKARIELKIRHNR